MTDFDRLIDRYRRMLAATDRKAAAGLLRDYQRVEGRLRLHVAALARQIEDARAAGVEVRPGWLFAQARYRALIEDLHEQTLEFARSAASTITTAQNSAVDVAADAAPDLAVAAAGAGPATGPAVVRSAFDRVPEHALRAMVGLAGDGTPLGDLLAALAPDSVQQVRDALAFGVATGKNPRVIAREVRQASGTTLGRALTISRTETMRAYRDASGESFRQSRVVDSWIWHASLGPRTCPVCIAMHGTEHPVTEQLESHPNCRCTMVPRTLSWEQLGYHGIPDRRPRIEPGPDVFARMSRARQRAVLGRARFDAFVAGDLRLQDVPRRTRSARWGGGLRQANLAELGLR